ncbi:type II toxin-antitoxin system ParD family antitoxin [Labrys okinawensis]|uniref:type II toxin-antitoxin system ParD family antitoxin n=1 Tax=Labrys okinawensis TaxID=346911 RepID=UPI0039BC2F77
MATMTVSLPDPMKEWIEGHVVGQGDYASVSDYVRDLIRRDRERRDEEMTLEDLRKLVADAKASGIGNRSVEEIFEAARKSVRSRGR